MTRYELRIKPSIVKDLRGMANSEVRCMLDRIETLRDNLRAPDCEKQASAGELHLVRQGAYRIVYATYDEQGAVEMVRVGHLADSWRGR